MGKGQENPRVVFAVCDSVDWLSCDEEGVKESCWIRLATPQYVLSQGQASRSGI